MKKIHYLDVPGTLHPDLRKCGFDWQRTVCKVHNKTYAFTGTRTKKKVNCERCLKAMKAKKRDKND